MSTIKKGHKRIAGFLCFLAVSFPASFALQSEGASGGKPIPSTEPQTVGPIIPTSKPSPIITVTTSKRNDATLVQAISEYLRQNGASEDFIELVPLTVTLCDLYDLDTLRPMAIMIHETDFGRSYAFKVNRNVCGLNWTDRQKKIIGINSDVYNLAVEKTVEASVMNLIHLLDMYRNFKTPLITLTDIQTKYAPTNDSRNGLSGMDNSVWRERTIEHYKNIDQIYKRLEGSKNEN